jgi:hypothetical protein
MAASSRRVMPGVRGGRRWFLSLGTRVVLLSRSPTLCLPLSLAVADPVAGRC